MFDNLKTDDAIEEQGDSLGGQRILDSGLYDMDIDVAYFTTSEGGAMALNLTLKHDGSDTKQQLWVTGGDAKGNKNYYLDKNDATKKHYLPGFNQANALCLLSVGKDLAAVAQDCEDKVVGIYDFDLKKDVPTKVKMLMPLLNQKITVGMLKQTVDKTTKSGEVDANGRPIYTPTGETRDENEIDKMFQYESKKTVAEIRAEAEATFYEDWSTKWNGQVKMKAKGGANGTTKGTPQATKPAESLFGGK